MSPSAAPATLRAVFTMVGPRSSRPADALARPSWMVDTTATTMGRDTSRAEAGSCVSAVSTVESTSLGLGTTEVRATSAVASGGTTTTKTPMTTAAIARRAMAAARPRGMNRSSASTNGRAMYAMSPPMANGRSAGHVRVTTAMDPAMTAVTNSARPTAAGVAVASRAPRSDQAARALARAAFRSFRGRRASAMRRSPTLATSMADPRPAIDHDGANVRR